MHSTRALVDAIPQIGRIEAIVVRPDRRAPATTVPTTTARAGVGLDGDRHAERARTGTTRHVTLVQAEHLAVIAALVGRGPDDPVDPVDLRRNLVVSGLNLAGTRGRRLQVGDAVIEVTGPCHPCSRMEEVLGKGGFQAMRGHGGMTARVLADGVVTVGDRVTALPVDDATDVT